MLLSQVTFLHLFHHSSITIVVGSILRFDYSGDMFLPILLNAIVHVLMYSHYFVTALGIKSCARYARILASPPSHTRAPPRRCTRLPSLRVPSALISTPRCVFVLASGWRKHLTTMQLSQFCLISTQSYLAYRSGPECGAPDWAKLLMILYMASMLVLFGNFFMQRYIFNKPSADMCGVIKAVEQPERIQYNGSE